MSIKPNPSEIFSAALDEAVEEEMAKENESGLTTTTTQDGEFLLELPNCQHHALVGLDTDFGPESEVIEVTLVLSHPETPDGDRSEVEAAFTRRLYVNPHADFPDTCRHIATRLAPVIGEFLTHTRLPGPFTLAYDRYR